MPDVKLTEKRRYETMTDHRIADIDLGDDHQLWYVCWKPDRQLNPQYTRMPDIERFAAIVRHLTPEGEPCPGGYITFAQSTKYAKIMGDRPVWTVTTWEPLTITPSLACRTCGDHGWIQAGKWVKA